MDTSLLFFWSTPERAVPLACILGLILGSFYNVCIERYLADEPFFSLRSHCRFCKEKLLWSELIPVVSYLFLGGRCGHCGKPIGRRYPITELLSGIISGLLAWRFGLSPAFWVYLFFTGLLIVASGIDWQSLILPDFLTLGGTFLAMPAAVYVLGLNWPATLLGAGLGGGSFFLILFLFKWIRRMDGMGLGDVKLMLLLGALCGPLALPLITFTAAASGLAVTLAHMCFQKRPLHSFREVPVPFGPFLSLGALVHILAGREILFWWLYLL